MLKYLGVSRSGYRSWLNRTPSDTEKRREYIKAKIQDIFDQSKQNYGAPKITRKLRQKGETISERTVGKYMKEMGIKAQWVKPWTITTILNYLDNNGMLEGDYDTNQAYAGQLNATYKINDWINVQTHNTIESRKTRSVSQNAYNSLTSVIGASYLYDPTVPLTYASDDLAPATMLAGENLGYTLLRDEQGRLYGASEMMNEQYVTERSKIT